jgi:hypothetical protein
MHIFILTTVALALVSTGAMAQDRYIQLVGDQVPIRFSPSSTSQLVATGRKGDVFRLSAEQAGWFEIYMFSGEGRFIAKAAAPHPSSPARGYCLGGVDLDSRLGPLFETFLSCQPGPSNLDSSDLRESWPMALADQHGVITPDSFATRRPRWHRG